MNAIGAASVALGAIAALLGLLWIVQGLGIVQIGPLLCVADCEPITGRSTQWAVVGVLALVVGLAIGRLGLRRTTR